MTRRLMAAAALAAATAALSGCGGDGTAEVTGTVTFDGQPVAKGAITFLPADGQGPSAGGPITDGKYTARVPAGKARVVINGTKVIGKKKLYNTPDSPERDVAGELLPKKYNEKSELTFDVRSGRNEKDWTLSSK